MNGPWQPVQEAQALASELRCHIMSLGQNVVASKDVRVFFESAPPEATSTWSIYFYANSWRFWEERWTLTMKAVRRNVNKLQDWQAWLLQLRQFHKVSSCPVRFYVALSCDLQKGCFGSRQPYCASCPSKLAFKRLDLQLVPEVFLVENLEVEICLQTPLWHSDLGFLIAVTIQGKSHLPGCILSILAEIPKPYDGQKFSIVLVVVSFCLGFFRFFLGVAGQYYPY